MAWDKTKPAGSTKIRLSDEEIRANWTALEAALGADLCLLGGSGATAIPMYRDTAPTNWTIKNTLNDKLLFVTKGSVAGGLAGGIVHATGSWTISGLTKDAHTHGVTSNVAVANHTALAVNNHSNHTALSLNNEGAHTHAAAGTLALAHTHAGPSHNHKWYDNQGAAAHHKTYTSGGAATDLANNVMGGFRAIMGDTSGDDMALSDSWTNNAGTGNTGAASTEAITGSTAAGSNHTHTFSQDIDAHSAHSFSQDIDAHVVTNNAVTSGAQSDAAVTHTPAWRPAGYNVILASKD